MSPWRCQPEPECLAWSTGTRRSFSTDWYSWYHFYWRWKGRAG